MSGGDAATDSNKVEDELKKVSEEPGPSGEPEKEPTDTSSSTDTTDKASTPSTQDTTEQKVEEKSGKKSSEKSGQDKKEPASAKPQISKIEVRLQPTGDAPIMKKRKWAVDPGKTIGQINKFVRDYIKLDEKENLFMYVNQAFAPSPDQTVHNLYQCFGSDGNLVLHYSKNQAWG